MRQNTIAFLLICALSLSACGQNPEDARKELGQMNIPYSERSFIEAADNGDILSVKLFLHAGMNVNATIGYETALRRAIHSKRTEIIKLLLDNGANPNAAGGTPFEEAVTQGSVELVELLLDKGANPNLGPTLGNAVQNENIEITKLLLDKGADINASPVLEIAAQKGNNELAKILVLHGANVNIQNGEPLRIALRANNYNLAEFLLNNGADPNIIDRNEDPVLLMLAEKGNTSLMSLLLNKGANVNATDDYKTTALMIAVGAGHIDTARLLLDKGADINARQDFGGAQVVSSGNSVTGATALLRAISGNNTEMLKFVLSRVTDINANGGEALMYAADRGTSSSDDYSNMVKILIDNNANVNVKDRNGKTPLQIARAKYGNYCYSRPPCNNTIALLKAAGGSEFEESVPQQSKLPYPLKYNSPVIDKADAIAVINGQYIAKSNLEQLEKEIAERGHGQTFPKEKLIEELIQRELLVQDAILKQLDKSPEFKAQLEAAKKALLSTQKQLYKSPELMAQLEAAKKTLLTQVDVQNFIKANPVTDAEIKAEYNSKVAGENGTEYKARHILVKTEDEAKKLIEELDKGAYFAKLANKKSLDAKESQNGGDLGWFVAGQMVVPFSEAVIKLDKGKYTKTPVHTQFGWHVILREDSRTQTAPSFEAAKEQLIPYLQRKKVQNMVETLRKQAKVEILVPLTPSESKPAVTREPLKYPNQEVKVQTQDQQTIQTPSINLTTQTFSPSFNCAIASTNSEHLICSNANLAAVDVEMAKIYKQVFENANDKKSLMHEQNQWRKNYRDVCKDVACMLNAYAERTKQLNQQEE